MCFIKQKNFTSFYFTLEHYSILIQSYNFRTNILDVQNKQ